MTGSGVDVDEYSKTLGFLVIFHRRPTIRLPSAPIAIQSTAAPCLPPSPSSAQHTTASPAGSRPPPDAALGPAHNNIASHLQTSARRQPRTAAPADPNHRQWHR
ncbi:hypothetical protein LINGRAHAP2_LOCUS17513 [Linum grandiflorum]